MADKQQQAAKEFAEYWKGKGYEKPGAIGYINKELCSIKFYLYIRCDSIQEPL